MQYYKNTDLAKLYNTSEKSVRNWIQATLDGKLDLQLYKVNDKYYIANVTKNTVLIEQLVEKGKKYKNSRGIKVVRPTQKFYDTFSSKQIFDIISSLTIHRELPLKYSYVDGGATYWDKYAQRLLDEHGPNMLNSTVNLLDSNIDHIESILNTHKKVNVIDLGPGNALPIRNILEYLISKDKLDRYIALDISKEMLVIAEENIKAWFGETINYEGYVRDFSHERFDDLLAEDFARGDDDLPVNLVFLLGGTLCNLRSPNTALQAINASLGVNDVMIYSTKLDTPNSRRFFDFNISAEAQVLAPRHRLVLELLGIDDSLYEVEQLFDQEKQARLICVKLKVAVSIEFQLARGVRRIELNKGESILLWRYLHQNALNIIDQFDQCDFNLQQAIKSYDQEYFLLTSKIKLSD